MKGTTNIPVIDVILRREGKVLFLLRQNTGWRDGLYSLPGGHAEGTESFKRAACRELMEEVGIEITPNQLEHRITFHTHGDQERPEIRVGVFFEAINWSGEPRNNEPEKHAELAWFDPDDLPENVTPNVKLMLESIKVGKKYIEYGWAE